MSMSGEDMSEELPFATLPSTPLGLAITGNYVFSVDGSGAWVTHYTFSTTGTMISSVDWNYRSYEYVWSEINQKIYFFRDDTSPNDLLWEEINSDGTTYPDLPAGGIGKKQDSPDHSSAGIKHPIHVKKDGSLVLLGSGVFRNATSLAKVEVSLANEITDAVFVQDKVVTIRDIADLAQIQEWTGSTMELGEVIQMPGIAHALLETSDNKLVAITIADDEIPSFYVLDASSLAIVSPSVLQTPSGLTAEVASSQIDLAWTDVSGELGYIIERNDGTNGWAEIARTGMSETSYQDGFVDPNIGEYGYRIIAIAGALQSAPSAEVLINFGVPLAPTNLDATVSSTNMVTLSWDPAADAEKYVIERKDMTNNGQTMFREIATITKSGGSYYYDDPAEESKLATSYEDYGLNPGKLSHQEGVFILSLVLTTTFLSYPI